MEVRRGAFEEPEQLLIRERLGRRAPRRIFAAHAAHFPHAYGVGTPGGMRCSLTNVRCARCAAPRSARIWTTWIDESLVEVSRPSLTG